MIWANSGSPFTATGVAEDEIGCLVLKELLLFRIPGYGTHVHEYSDGAAQRDLNWPSLPNGGRIFLRYKTKGAGG